MKKKILTVLLTLVLSLTIMFGVSGCKTGSSAILKDSSQFDDKGVYTAKTLDFSKFTLPYWDEKGVFQKGDGNNSDMQDKRIKDLNEKLGAITYDADGDIKTTEDQKKWTNYEEFSNAGGIVSGLNITKKTTGSIMTLTYLDATLEIKYTVS